MPPSVVLLWLATYFICPIAASFLLGPSMFRKRIVAMRRELLGPLNASVTVTTSTAVSTLIQIGATVGTAHILQIHDHTASLRSMVLLWFSRPLATPVILWLALMDLRQYADNSWEIARVDAIYGLVSIAMFGVVAEITNQAHPGNVPPPARLARAGSAVGILQFIWGTLGIGVNFIPKVAPRLMIFAFCMSSLRFVACWLLVAGLFFSNPTAFCPDSKTMNRILAVWLLAAIVDHLWRMLAAPDDDSDGGENADIC